MGITLQPREQFAIVRQLQDHTDSGTYYVRAVVRNSRTDAVIDTVNLTDRTNRRFTALWQVIADTSGQGLFVDICTSVYTDSGYTTKSENYGDESETYLIDNRQKATGGGASGDVDYKKIKKMLSEAISTIKIPDQKEIEMPEYPETDLSMVHEQLESIISLVTAIPLPEKVDLQPVLDAIDMSEDRIRQSVLDIPEAPKVDFEPVLEAIKKMDMQDTLKTINALVDSLNTQLPDISDWANKFKEQLKEFLYVTSGAKTPKQASNDRAMNLISR